MRDEVILETKGLWSGYGGKPVLQGADLTIRKGEIVAIIGRNGVGKSTLIKSLIGLLPSDKGSVLFQSKPIDALAAYLRARLGIGYVPQGRDVFPRMSVLENMAVGESIGGSFSKDRLREIFGFFPILRERKHQLAGTLSGGQQQQLAIGRVLMGAPSLILLDEPSEGIQPNIVQDIARIMVELNRTTGVTIVFVEQNIDMIRAMAQRCYVMDKGRLVAELTKDMLQDRETVRRYLSV
ncbi:ABC transporter ATP-binding protein [Phyllobacterium phragmitis]|uniref:ABC transporter ATP-binding protein n=1 Tax=Phyllobacterium phragmitis TaxID=2670329 RepID=A0A2S9IJA0_9HYPH|nr:ABC transporter ATP-binding protein [Phyllobacterium phragmitis]PRD40589.1 ABC transporter ATP-binding protein [Phyllobacterium phragmitis]